MTYLNLIVLRIFNYTRFNCIILLYLKQNVSRQSPYQQFEKVLIARICRASKPHKDAQMDFTNYSISYVQVLNIN